MATNAQEIYNQITNTLSLTERLRLASLLLDDLKKQNVSVIDDGNDWTDEDIEDITRISMDYANRLYPEGE
jgi:hypothetical protein